MRTSFHILLLFVSSSSSNLIPNFPPPPTRSFRRYLQHPSGVIIPIEAWPNDVNLNSVAGKYEEEEEWFGRDRNNVVGNEDPWYEEELEAQTNESELPSREMPLRPRALVKDGTLGLGLAKTAFQSLRGDTAEKLELPEDRKRLIELVRKLFKPKMGSLITPGFVERLLDQKIELSIGSEKKSNPNEKIKTESQPDKDGAEEEAGVAVGDGGQVGAVAEGQVKQRQQPQPVLLLLEGWLVHV